MVERKHQKTFSVSKTNGYSCTESRNNRVTSFMFFNFPDSWSRIDCWKLYEKYGVVKDVYLPRKRLSSGQRFGFVRFEGIHDINGFVKVLNNIQINGRWVRTFKAMDRKMGGVSHPDSDVGKGPTLFVSKNDNSAAKGGSSDANRNPGTSKTLMSEGRSFVDIVKGSNQNTSEFHFPVCNRIQIKVGGKCLELNLLESVNNHKLVFSYNNDSLSWTLVELNSKPYEVVDRDGTKTNVDKNHVALEGDVRNIVVGSNMEAQESLMTYESVDHGPMAAGDAPHFDDASGFENESGKFGNVDNKVVIEGESCNVSGHENQKEEILASEPCKNFIPAMDCDGLKVKEVQESRCFESCDAFSNNDGCGKSSKTLDDFPKEFSIGMDAYGESLISFNEREAEDEVYESHNSSEKILRRVSNNLAVVDSNNQQFARLMTNAVARFRLKERKAPPLIKSRFLKYVWRENKLKRHICRDDRRWYERYFLDVRMKDLEDDDEEVDCCSCSSCPSLNSKK